MVYPVSRFSCQVASFHIFSSFLKVDEYTFKYVVLVLVLVLVLVDGGLVVLVLADVGCCCFRCSCCFRCRCHVTVLTGGESLDGSFHARFLCLKGYCCRE